MKRLLLASVFAALPFAAGAADIEPIEYSWIEDNAPAGHQATVTFSLAATYFDMDVSNGFSAYLSDGDGNFSSQPDDGFAFDTWGITGGVEAWLPTTGSRYFIGGLDGAWVEDDLSSVVDLTAVGGATNCECLVPLPIAGGLAAINAINNYPFPVDLSASSEFYRVAGFAGVGTDVANGTKVGVGVYAAYSELDLDAIYRNSDFPQYFSQIDETVKTWSGGLALLGETRREVMRGVGVFVKGRVAALYANGELDANQNAFDLTNASRAFSAGDNADKFAGLAEGQVGLDFALGPNASLSIFGGAAWRNDVFEIINPQAGPGDNFFTTTFEPADLKQTDLIEYSAGGKVEFNF